MEKLSKEELQDLAECIRQAIAQEFSVHHLSGNLVKTIEIEAESIEKFKVIIPAPTYNMYKFFTQRVITPSPRGGSYASKLNDEGSAFMVYWGTSRNPKRQFVEPRNHIGYLDRVIDSAIQIWLIKNREKFQLKSREEM